jgi:hypothetical protein
VTVDVEFRQFMEEQITKHPEDVVVADTDQLRRIGKLVRVPFRESLQK